MQTTELAEVELASHSRSGIEGLQNLLFEGVYVVVAPCEPAPTLLKLWRELFNVFLLDDVARVIDIQWVILLLCPRCAIVGEREWVVEVEADNDILILLWYTQILHLIVCLPAV